MDLIANNEIFCFIAFLLETYLADKDIDLAIREFISALGNPTVLIFLYKEDLEQNRLSIVIKVIGGRTFGSIVCDGLIQYLYD